MVVGLLGLCGLLAVQVVGLDSRSDSGFAATRLLDMEGASVWDKIVKSGKSKASMIHFIEHFSCGCNNVTLYICILCPNSRQLTPKCYHSPIHERHLLINLPKFMSRCGRKPMQSQERFAKSTRHHWSSGSN